MTTTRKEDRDLAKVQLAVTDQDALLPADERATEVAEGNEDAKPGLYAEIAGRKFLLSEDTGYMALMEWAAAGDGEASVNQVVTSNLRAMYHVLQDVVHEDEFESFRAYTREKKCKYPDFVAFQNAAFEAMSANPTE